MTRENMSKPKEQVTVKKDTSLLQTAGLGSVEATLHKIPFVGKALPFIFVNLATATIFYFLCYSCLWLFSKSSQEEGEWFIRYTDLLGKSHSRLTTYAAEQIAYFVAGVAACLFTFANFSNSYNKHFLIKTVSVALIPLGVLILIKIFPAIPVYIPKAFLYGQFFAMAIVCFGKSLGRDKKATYAKS